MVLRSYFRSLGFSPEEIEPIVENWSRNTPQTPEEIRQGLKWERENRLRGGVEPGAKS